MDPPDVHYARSGDVSIAYQVVGDGPQDVVIVRGSLAHLDSVWEQPLFVSHVERLASFARVLLFDKRGMGLSDRLRSVPTLEARMDDVRAVMDAAGLERAALFAAHEGTRLAILFAATYPERTAALVLFDPSPKGRRSPDYPWARSDDEWRDWLREVGESWGTPEFFARQLREYTPTRADDEDSGLGCPPHAPEREPRRRRRVPAHGHARRRHRRPPRHPRAHARAPSRRVGRAGRVRSRAIPDAVRRDVPGLVDGFSWADPAGNGRLLDEAEAFLRGLDRAAAPERVLATILFTDIVDSTRRAAELGDAGWRELLGRHNALVRRQLSEFRGTELNTTGDGFVASFDGPLRGLSCARAIRDEVRGLGLEIRAGLHTGEGELAGGRVGGIVLHTVARVAAAAGPGEVFVSGTVKDLVAGSGVEFDDRGTHVLKGVPGEWRLVAVREAGTVPASR